MNDISILHLVNGGFTIVSTEDFSELNKERWFRNAAGYAIRQWHRLGKVSCEWMHKRVNRTPSTLQCDHINQCKFDNSRRNLRRSNKTLDSLNRTRKGVYLHKSGLWCARVHSGKCICKYFKTETEALEAYRRIHAEEVARISSELALVPDDYSPAVIPAKKNVLI